MGLIHFVGTAVRLILILGVTSDELLAYRSMRLIEAERYLTTYLCVCVCVRRARLVNNCSKAGSKHNTFDAQ